VFSQDGHSSIVCPIAVTAESKDPSVARLLEFLGSPTAKTIFEKHGFTVLA
jgi:ABC-type molybdate transport system substrate-binding protein